MAHFDEICGCSYETRVCVCVRKKWQARSECKQCLAGQHSLEMREPEGDRSTTEPAPTNKETVSHDERLRLVAKNGSEQLVDAVRGGQVSIHLAARIVDEAPALRQQLDTAGRAVWPWNRWSEWKRAEVQRLADEADCTFTSQGNGYDLVFFNHP